MAKESMKAREVKEEKKKLVAPPGEKLLREKALKELAIRRLLRNYQEMLIHCLHNDVLTEPRVL